MNHLRTLSTAALATCALVFSAAIPVSATSLMGASPGTGAGSSALSRVAARDGFVRSLGTASALVPRATGYDAVDPAQGYGTITGRVTLPAGVALDWANVRISDSNGDRVDDAYAGGDGTFGVTGLDAGTYRLTATGGSANGKPLTGGPVEASVTLGSLTSGVVVPLAIGSGVAAGSIEGTVTGPRGSALLTGSGGDIDVFDSTQRVGGRRPFQ